MYYICSTGDIVHVHSYYSVWHRFLDLYFRSNLTDRQENSAYNQKSNPKDQKFLPQPHIISLLHTQYLVNFITSPRSTKRHPTEPIKSFDFSMKRPLHRKARLVLIRRVILRMWWEPLGLFFGLSLGDVHSARCIRIGGRRRLSMRLFHQSFLSHSGSNRCLLQASRGLLVSPSPQQSRPS